MGKSKGNPGIGRRPRAALRGTTLIEVAIAASVMVVGLLGFMQVIAMSVGSTTSNRQADLATQAAREVKGERRHVGAEGDLFRRRAQEVGQRRPRTGEHGVGLLAARVAPVRVGVVPEQILGHGIRHRAGDLRAARPVEVRHGSVAVLALQCGELGTDLADVENASLG